MDKINRIKIKFCSPDNFPILATASIMLYDSIIIRGIKIVENIHTKECFISWPTYKDKDGNHIGIVYSIDSKLESDINEKIMEFYTSSKLKLEEES